VNFSAALGIIQKVLACFRIGMNPTGNFSERAKTAQTNIISIQTTISYAG